VWGAIIIAGVRRSGARVMVVCVFDFPSFCNMCMDTTREVNLLLVLEVSREAGLERGWAWIVPGRLWMYYSI
jgi:hypothetical protein